MEIPLGLHATYWRQREWGRLLSLSSDNEADPAILLMLCGAALQMNDSRRARSIIARSVKTIGHKATCRFLFSFQEIQLARATYAAGQPKNALVLFQSAYKELGELALPLIYDFLFDLAEAQLAVGNARAAIQGFHDVAILLQEDTPEEVYHRMSDGYAINRQGFGGTKSENFVWGDCHKHDLLCYFHQELQPGFYFEIGVDEGHSLARAQGKALGVDARPKLRLSVEIPKQAKIVSLSSDRFFREVAGDYFVSPPELAFIDGMHLFEFALRDFINLEKYAAPYTLVCIDDVFPAHPVQAERRRISGSWTGDVWKLIPIFRKYRPDLNVICLPCSTTGLLLISGLDASNNKLTECYDEILHCYQKDFPVPKSILKREDSVPSDHPVISLFLNVLFQAKQKKLNLAEVKRQLSTLDTLIDQAKTRTSTQNYPKRLEQIEKEKQCEAHTKDVAQLFIPQPQSSMYIEARSIMQSFDTADWHDLTFEFELKFNHVWLRFYPSERTGLLEISNIEVIDIDADNTLLHFQGEAIRTAIKTDGDCFLLNNTGRFCIYSYGKNPMLFFPPVETVNQPLQLRVRMRSVVEGDDQRALWRNHIRT